MKRFLQRILHAIFGAPPDRASCAGEAKTETQVLREKIEKWERQADEYEAMGLMELARRSRESIQWYRLRLKALTDPSLRKRNRPLLQSTPIRVLFQIHRRSRHWDRCLRGRCFWGLILVAHVHSFAVTSWVLGCLPSSAPTP